MVDSILKILGGLVSYFAARGIDKIVAKYVAMISIAFERNATVEAKKIHADAMKDFIKKAPAGYGEWVEWRKQRLSLPDWARQNPYLQIIRDSAKRHDLPWDLVLAVVQTENGGRTYPTRYEPVYPYTYKTKFKGMDLKSSIEQQKTSWGPMQVMGSTAMDRGIELDYGPPSSMVNPGIGIEIGCRHLKFLSAKYKNPIDVYAAYNGGTPERARPEAVSRFKIYLSQL